MTRWLPNPVLTAALLAMWLLLSQSLSPGQVLLGAIAALLAALGLAALRPEPIRVLAIRPAIRLAGLVLADILRSNLAVGRIVLFRKRETVSGFVRIPLDMTNIHGLTVLACIITATPGTMWVRFDRATGALMIHVLDLVDEESWVRLIKDRYECLLQEIFGP
ncbi:Na+/H+ antiporter subunit E [Sphingosinicella terrae]|jgi:multicomponent K+:H+ antiporter subunit E|uniref:Na+/H+ antiporter subunit E n=1 Tax=Sphingosinicella terrae TaxID=2172047 RepID=UPI000E0D6CC2|nr:Na+/H+ antiporter subunit E [Sphingosinicella terrae]